MKIPVPQPTKPDSIESQFGTYVNIIKILRQYCPWDKEQTHETLAPLTIEEVYEVTDAINKSNSADISEELGDVLLHIVMHSLIAEEQNTFSLKDVIQMSALKMIKRHPHIFDDYQASNSDEILKIWEQIKTQHGNKPALGSVPVGLPSLIKAERIQQKASNVGFDWNNVNDAWDKFAEEMNEFKFEIKQGDMKRMEEEFGDVLFSLVNVARFLKIIPENALQKTNNKFISRFNYIEAQAKQAGKDMSLMTLEEMDALWNEAKKHEQEDNIE